MLKQNRLTFIHLQSHSSVAPGCQIAFHDSCHVEIASYNKHIQYPVDVAVSNTAVFVCPVSTRPHPDVILSWLMYVWPVFRMEKFHQTQSYIWMTFSILS